MTREFFVLMSLTTINSAQAPEVALDKLFVRAVELGDLEVSIHQYVDLRVVILVFASESCPYKHRQ